MVIHHSNHDMPAIGILLGCQSLLDGLDASRAPGPDHISPKLLKLILVEARRCLKVILRLL